MKTDSDFYLKDKERKSKIKECTEMIRLYSTLRPPVDPRFRSSAKTQLDYYRNVRKKLTSDIRYENLLKRNSP